MAIPNEVRIPAFQGGKPFQPKVRLKDIKSYEDKEASLIAEGARPSAFADAKEVFLALVLARSVPDGQKEEVAFDDLHDMHVAFRLVWDYAFLIERGAAPLG